ncbi:hypothetical protein MN116_002322 [Schistosoma mekongi]|uniref:LIM zinc-binding domain-containing protein n=1 Tax=Schistosoma mekongi TaxID=38744 RepID=A0AAE1ZJT8_SCHME|nr:hypothetical protein MN116_002322 [Schistosoma mekongi]
MQKKQILSKDDVVVRFNESEAENTETQDIAKEPYCKRCDEPFTQDENIVSVKEGTYHPTCFVCAQCFQPLPNKEFYEFEGRRYCKYDFQVLFAPFCSKCGEFIMFKVVKAINKSWHPECLICDECGIQLVSKGFQRHNNRQVVILCKDCWSVISRALSGCYICQTCNKSIELNKHIKFMGDFHHPHHFHCYDCGEELGSDARERSGELYCLRCFGRTGISICSACRRPIDGRIVWALGKVWHVEHFVCHHCETPFMGSRFYEWQGHAYCLLHYQAKVGSICNKCTKPVTGILAKFTNKIYCPEHFLCSLCDRQLDEKSKLYEIDLKPVCKDCYDKLPMQWKKILAKIHRTDRHKWND